MSASPEDEVNELRQLAKRAIDLQDGVNPCGISQALHDTYRKLTNRKGTDYAARHPICKLILFKLSDLARCEGTLNEFTVSYNACKELAREN